MCLSVKILYFLCTKQDNFVIGIFYKNTKMEDNEQKKLPKDIFRQKREQQGKRRIPLV
jgi:hypothetical protein